ncbi:MAG: hypothetical protein GY822_04300 [Deltaproteobacteria bacterium]|nr:hypothetical protein [Deltaproteobacteria bacterium]
MMPSSPHSLVEIPPVTTVENFSGMTTHASRKRRLSIFQKAFALLVALVGSAALLPSSAFATQISHFKAAPGPHNYVVTHHPSVLQHRDFSAWFLTTYAHDPLVCRDDNFREIHKVVEHQIEGDLAGSFGLFDRFEIGGSLPVTYLYGRIFPA